MYHPVTKKNQLPSMTSTQLISFDEVRTKKFSGPRTTIQKNHCNFLFPRYKEEKVYVERGVYDTNNQLKMETFKYKQEGQFYLGSAMVESK